jgi:hypothetical protein
VRMGLRYRQFRVQGVPVTAASKIVLEVDPQLEPADLARTFARWQQSSKVTACHPDPKLALLAGTLIGRLRQKTEPNTRSRPRKDTGALPKPSAAPRHTWTTDASEVTSDRRLLTRRTAAVVRILMPFDRPHPPRWLPLPAPAAE